MEPKRNTEIEGYNIDKIMKEMAEQKGFPPGTSLTEMNRSDSNRDRIMAAEKLGLNPETATWFDIYHNLSKNNRNDIAAKEELRDKAA